MSQRERTVIVSGGTGALGRAVVEAFLETGAYVIVPWIDKGERDEVEALWQDALEFYQGFLRVSDNQREYE